MNLKEHFYSCKECQLGEYSLVDGMTAERCLICPLSSISCYKDKIILRLGTYIVLYQATMSLFYIKVIGDPVFIQIQYTDVIILRIIACTYLKKCLIDYIIKVATICPYVT